MRKQILNIEKHLIPVMFFLAFFLYFALLNKFTLSYQEQIQLFRFSLDYLMEYLARPAGMLSYMNSFIVQFFISPLTASAIVTIAAILIFTWSAGLLRIHRIHEKLWPFLLTMVIVALQSDYTYSFVNTFGYILVLGVTRAYVSFRNKRARYFFGLIMILPLTIFAGFFAILAAILWIIHELLFAKDQYRYFIAAGYLVLFSLIPYITWHLNLHFPLLNSITSPMILPGNSVSRYSLFTLFAILPAVLLLSSVIPYYNKESGRTKAGNLLVVSARVALLAAACLFIYKYSYSARNEQIFRMDNRVQHQKWQEVISLSSKIRQPDRTVSHFTNLALFKSGKLGDELFRYNPADQSFLWLSYPEVQYPYFFGFDVFYHLGYINKAYAWAYDAMIGSGPSPRLVKQLSLISLINGNLPLAGKYLGLLDESLFYRKWSATYRKYLENTDLISRDQEIMSKRSLSINADFNGDTSIPDSILVHLLQNHPENKMAYEYYLSTLLLEKNISDFTWYASDLGKYGYKAIPVHFEEALLINMYYTQKNVIPQGFSIRPSTTNRFGRFMNLYSSRPTDKKLYDEFGNTYWYYFYFLNKKAQVR